MNNFKDIICFSILLICKYLKLIYPEKARKVEKIFHLVMTFLSKCQNKMGYFFKLYGILRKLQLYQRWFNRRKDNNAKAGNI